MIEKIPGHVTLPISNRTEHTKYFYVHLTEVSSQTHLSFALKTISNSSLGLKTRNLSHVCELDTYHLKMLPTSTTVLR